MLMNRIRDNMSLVELYVPHRHWDEPFQFILPTPKPHVPHRRGDEPIGIYFLVLTWYLYTKKGLPNFDKRIAYDTTHSLRGCAT